MAVTFQATAFNSATTPKSTASMSWANGDEIVAIGLAEGANVTLNTPTATGLTFALETSQTTGATAECGAYLWRATATSSGSGAIEFSRGATSGFFGGMVWVRTGTSSTVTALTGNVSETAYNPTVAAGDDVIVAAADWTAATTDVAPTTGSGTATRRINTNATNLHVWGADWQGTTAGAATFGLADYTGWRAAQVGIVLSAGAAPGSVLLDQNTYRWGLDDGDEATHTWDAAENTATTVTAGQRRLLRVQLEETGGADRTGGWTLQYRRSDEADTEWRTL